MIVQTNTTWLRMLFAVRHSSIWHTWPRVLAITGFAGVVTAVVASTGYHPQLNMSAFTPLGLALAIFLGFRNNESYQRFWEGRKLWGRMVNVARTFARQILTLTAAVPGSADEGGSVPRSDLARRRRRIVRGMIAYVHAFRHHLRESDPHPELTEYLEPDAVERVLPHSNRPMAVAQILGEELQQLCRLGYLDPLHLPAVDASLTEVLGVQGGCERIKNTPIPFSYSVLLHRVVTIYCLALPFALFDISGVYTPAVVFVLAYAFFGLDAIGDDVEQPFDTQDNDLPLHGLSRTIEINLLELLGETPLPAPIQPVDGVLV